jgi:hypothetical protein
MVLFSAARDQAAENNINLFSADCSLATKNNYFSRTPTTLISIFDQFSIHKIHIHIQYSNQHIFTMI